jgi:hypothetical protein
MTTEAFEIDVNPVLALRGGGIGAKSGGTKWFKMTGVSMIEMVPTLVAWTVKDKPDPAGTYYHGPGTAPTGIYVSCSWLDS